MRPKFSLAKVAAGVAMSMALAGNAHAVSFDSGKWRVTFDSTFSWGMSYRLNDADPNNIGKFNSTLDENGASLILGRGQDYTWSANDLALLQTFGSYLNPQSPDYNPDMVNGVYSLNGDDGNLNFAQSGLFSNVLKSIHELDINFDENYGIFARGTYFHDFEVTDGDYGHWVLNPNFDAATAMATGDFSGMANWVGLSNEAKKQHGERAELLDAFFYGTWDVFDLPMQIRLGKQVINWGESTFIQHGLAEANPLDLAKLRVPGAELREAFLPISSLWVSYELPSNVALEAYYLMEWEPLRIDASGTYFSTADFAGVGGNHVQLGFGLSPDGWRQALILDDEVAFATGVKQDPSDSGQFGTKLAWLAEDWNYTEFAFYYVNYHNKRPVISAHTFGPVPGQTGVMAPYGYFEYLEDIQMYGMSFNTTLDSGWSIAGEISYREDEPLQVDDVELLFATVQITGLIPDNTSQIPQGTFPGEKISGYRLMDTWQGQATFTNLFGPGWGAEERTFLFEVGVNHIESMGGLRFEAPGTERSGNPMRDGLDANGFPMEGSEDSEFATATSWGYRTVLKLDYTNAFWGINMAPRVVFQHDVNGKTPAPISNFHEDRKSVSYGITFDYLSQWKADIKYNRFFGAGDENRLADRDFVSFTISYSI